MFVDSTSMSGHSQRPMAPGECVALHVGCVAVATVFPGHMEGKGPGLPSTLPVSAPGQAGIHLLV